ncbi:CU044_5270 family protein [Actinomadura macrotermitis]|uniref:CU044_5270 family protein n=1 Tax=Actinomadura macrotermitis TaxID=2585200 RepID=A0A7K0BXM7_9ACTN|nr:CU044_5270 family protein [Actinomadura macrotermitis]MQY05935.1 hypothetical protein [Actinomadura macrotermitis]
MREIEALRQMRTALAEQEHPDRLAMRAGWRPGGPAPRARRGWRLPVAGLLATATVAAGSAAVLSLTPDEDAGTGAPQPGDVLLVAATNALKARTGKYWHTRRIDGTIYAVGRTAADHYKIEARQGYETWVDPAGRGYPSSDDLPARPWTPEDMRKWRKAGAPSQVQIPSGDGSAPITLFMKPSPAQGRKFSKGWHSGSRFYNLPIARLAQLPTEPKALENALLDLRGDWHAYSKQATEEPLRALRGPERVRALSDVLGDLLARQPAPARVRAAAFRLLAGLPGVRAEGRAADPLGRTGTVVSLPLETTIPLGVFSAPKQLGTYRRQWIIDPGTGTLLAIRDLVARPPHGSRALPPGDDGRPRRLTVATQPDRFHKPGEVAAYEVFEAAGWTDTAPN